MAGSKILVLGATGPAGICLLRELLHRNHDVIAYARNPSKIPEDLSSNAHLTIIKGEMTDTASLSKAISQSSAILSLLGPSTSNIRGTTYATQFPDYYTKSVFPLMREHSVRRIFAMGTLSIPRPEDGFSILAFLMVCIVRLFASTTYRNVLGIAEAFEKEATGLDWTVYRIAGLPGGQDKESWAKDRNNGDTYVGIKAGKGWSVMQKRAALTRWLVDAVEDGATELIGKMPAVSKLAGSGEKTAD